MSTATWVNRIIPALFCASSAVLIGTADTQAQEWHGTVETIASVQQVHNPESPIHEPQTIALTELWRLDGESDETPFGIIYDAVADEQGVVYLLDYQLKQVVVVDATGHITTRIGREGDGPSEIRRPNSILIDNSGNIGIAQNPPAKISLLTPTGAAAGDRLLPDYAQGQRLILRSAQMAAGRLYLVLARWRHEEAGETSYFNAVASLGDGQAEYTVHLEQTSRRGADNNLYTERERSRGMPWEWTVGPSGLVYTSSTFDAYRILVHDNQGNLVSTISRDYESRPRSTAHVVELQDYYDRRFAGMARRGQPMSFKVSPTDQDIEMIFARQDEMLWVLPSRGAYDKPADAVGTFDVFDQAGRFTRQISLLGVGDLSTDYLIFTRDLLIVVRGVRLDLGQEAESEDSASLPYEVICYRMP